MVALPIVISTGMCRGNAPDFEGFYSQLAHTKSQFYFHNACKINPLRYGNDVS